MQLDDIYDGDGLAVYEMQEIPEHSEIIVHKDEECHRGKNRCGGASGAAKKKHPDIRALNKLFLSKSDEQRVKNGVKVV